MRKKIIRLNEQDIERLVNKIIKEDDDLKWIKEIPGNPFFDFIDLSVSLNKPTEESYPEEGGFDYGEFDYINFNIRVPKKEFLEITDNHDLSFEEYEIITTSGEQLLQYAYDCKLNPEACKKLEDFGLDNDTEGTITLED